ncbi:conserved hypothetical protein [Pseudomonas sp. 8AS]|uniref:DUF2946 domain-containing protein n=1 Tax=Pseudomonas sp. 8AS TaxID=2653163 RepID=UPI0012F3FF43|nr:DUF2946 domain-containing protein [Pseudomonas sp. 8AS]VXC22386.1 conserved hypothetical protein [Pseudomonas sp. 8AS]
MTLTRDHRTLIAWALYTSLLLSLFACGLHHGQASGLRLSGLQGGFCAEGSNVAAVDLGEGSPQHQADAFSCPLCSSYGLAVALHSHAWAAGFPPAVGGAPSQPQHWAQPPPRYLWPSLNPRASPTDLPA